MRSETGKPLAVSTDFVDQLATLQTRLIDVLAGYKTMQEKAENEIAPVINDYISTHTRHEQDLASRLNSLGHEPDEDGSFFSVIQQAVVQTRSIFTSIGTNTLPQVIDGEKMLIDLYQETLMRADKETDQELLKRQMHSLSELNRRTEALVAT